MKKLLGIPSLMAVALMATGCATTKGTVYKQSDGNYKAAYASSSERDVMKVLHSDAQITCKKKEKTKEFRVVEENVEEIEKEKKTEGFSAVAGSAVSLAGKYFGAESVRGSLIFTCDPS